MEDVITEAAPPSRFLEEDLNIFTPPSPSPPLPSPFLIFPFNQPQPFTPSLLIIALSPSSLALFHNPISQPPLASLILPELPFSNNPTITILPLSSSSSSSSALLAAFPSVVSPHRAHAVAKLLLHRLRPTSVLILDSLLPNNFRAGLSSDQTLAFKLDTSAERKTNPKDKMLPDLEYYPSGSVVDGMGAAILARCQLMNVRASLCVSWPRFDHDVVALLKGLLHRAVLPGFEFRETDEVFKFGRSKDRVLHSELYI